ncbi:MAG: hypothetical protein AAF526_08615 [Pseudomonadota bacterium]
MSKVHYPDAVAAVLEQDLCLQDGSIDVERWSTTVFLPLTMVAGGRTFAICDQTALCEHLRALERKSRELRIASFRTNVKTVLQASDDMSIISVVRERLRKDGVALGKSSITFSILRVEEEWLINQVMFNDSRHDPSVVAQAFLRWSDY